MTVLASALAFAARGHPVLPLHYPVGTDNKFVCSCGRLCGKSAAKHPYQKVVPKGLTNATAESGVVKHWFGYVVPDANLGVACDRLVVLDIDPRHDGDQSLAELEHECALPDTWRVLTGGGGEHILFSCPDGVSIKNYSPKPGSVPPLGVGIDIRARGGYIVAPPSRHISGRAYEFSVDHHPQHVALAPLPEWLAERLITRAGRVPDADGGDAEPKPGDEWAALTSRPISEYRDDAALSIAGHFFRHNCNYDLVRGMLHAWNSAWCKPPLGYHELDKLIDRVADYHAARIEQARAMRGGPHGARERLYEAQEQKREHFNKAKSARGNGSANEDGVTLDDFFAYMPMHSYIYAPTRDMWPASSVNARVPPVALVDGSGQPVLNEDGKQKFVSASVWLDRNKPVEQMTWAPGLPMTVHDRLISEGGWVDRKDVTVFNLYRAPTIEAGNAAEADRWLAHLRKVYPDDIVHIVKWCAHRVQRPHEKINHALVLGGLQGIGKDTLLEPVKRAVGPWNFHEVSPQHLLGRFNGYLKSVILRVSEARDLGEVNRFSFYDHMKAYTAAPPDVLRVDEKHLREYSVPNCCGVVITTNHKADGIFLPADDRRHYVAWSGLDKDDFAADYWSGLWSWYDRGGDRHVTAYLAGLDLTGFNPKAPPPKTAAFWDIVDANRAPEDAELADVLDDLGNPDALTLSRVQSNASGDFQDWLRERKNRRQIPYRFEQCGYVPVRNNAAGDGLWKVHGRRQVVYAKASLSLRDRLAAAQNL